MPRPSQAKLKALKREIARKYRQRTKLHPVSIAALRVNEIERLFQGRYGDQLPDDDAGRDDVAIMLNHLACMSGDPRRRCRSWLKTRAPWLTIGESEAMIGKIIMEPHRYSADKLAWKLHLLDCDRTTLKITTIGAVDCNKDQRLQRRKEKHAERARKRRKLRKLQR